MLKAELFDKLVSRRVMHLLWYNSDDAQEYIAQCIRKDSRPFGGIQVATMRHYLESPIFNAGQLVLAGDFFQLPPVSSQGSSRPPDYVFSAKSWDGCIPKPYFLQKVFRQNDDGTSKLVPFFFVFLLKCPDFISLLSAMRLGSLTQQQNIILQNLQRPLICNVDIQPAML
jgi:hypothetical protein